jgi:hypothetical protein
MAGKRDNINGAPDKAHGTHGKGDAEERLQSEAPTKPGGAGPSKSGEQHGEFSDAGWGSDASGGSVADKRSPKRS